MRRLCLTVSVLLLVGPLLRPAVSAPSGDPANGPIAVSVTAPSGVNVRSGPSTGSTILGVAPSGQVYAATDHQGDWYKIFFDGRSAWIHGSWLTDASNALVQVTASSLNVRDGASTSDNVIGHASSGEIFAATGDSSGWKKISFGTGEGWVSGAYVTAVSGGVSPAPAPTPAPAPAPAPTPAPAPSPTTHPTSARGFIQLEPSGTGFFCVSPETRRWGTPRYVYGIERVGRRWSAEHPAGCPDRFAVMDISLENGGPISGHASHQKGVDADFALPRNDGLELPRVDRFSSAYSRPGTQKLVNLFRGELDVTMIFNNDPNISGVQPWPNHDNHIHVRIR